MNDMLADGFAATSLTVLLNQGAIVGEPKTGGRRFWTTREFAILREHYPKGGIAACLPLLPGRAASAIYQKAFEEGLRSASKGKPAAKRQTYTATPALDAAITEAYLGDDTLQALKNLSRLTGRPRAWFTNRAAVLGLSRPKFREPDWCDAELAILDAKAHLSPGYIRELLRDAGYRRTVNAIVIKLRRRRGWQREKADSRYSKLMLMECFGVSGGVLSRWAADYGLKVEREWRMAGDRHEPPSPKAEWNVRASELRRFVADNVAIIDFRKVDKFWLVDLLTSRGDPEAVGEARARGRGTTNKGDDA